MTTRWSYILATFVLSFQVNAQAIRQQEPKAPYSYEVEEVVFQNTIDGISLAGTLTYPQKGSDFPAVILISGSGPQDRNSELMNHKPFLVIADHLTKMGIAVLRVDDRGAGESEGDYNKSAMSHFVKDTKSALDFLKTYKKIQSNQIGLIGHSLGGNIAPIVASEREDIAFIVLLAGSGIRGDQLMLLQKAMIERKMGVPEVSVAQAQTNMKGAYDIILNSDGKKEELQKQLNEYFTTKFAGMIPEQQVKTIAEQMSWPWFVDFIKFDPAPVLQKVDCPVLAINGSNDVQVPAEENLQAIEKALIAGGNEDIQTQVLEKLNHLFQESETGLPNEYATIQQTFSPVALEIITDWIEERTK
ncbi:hypothetical protein SAMN05661096_03442 [Marivirga sericea]|uniref:Serine aminopeptidase S33 domain-containing protein n=1 Tax=Marivirga sericea TaxID=1028 RepID=A0A1X7L3G8_9BACT|nr:alpha/beta hydrolase [Marivirga sericea]SMG48245.1 hypothetical protein SAMN05661096_03442 [Marivirga sericea]